jgi:hypothetical protein
MTIQHPRPTGAPSTSSAQPARAQTAGPNARADNSARFREALRRANERDKNTTTKKSHKSEKPEEASSEAGAPWSSPATMLLRGDGTYVSATHARGPSSRSELGTVLAEQSEAKRSAVTAALDDVRVGRSEDSVRVHATLAEGRHRGVELRAVERGDGRVEVELRAADPAALDRLRAELPELRAALDHGPTESVTVSVVAAEPGAHAGSRDGQSGREHREPERERREGRDEEDARGTSASEPAQPSADDRWELL